VAILIQRKITEKQKFGKNENLSLFDRAVTLVNQNLILTIKENKNKTKDLKLMQPKVISTTMA
jgi:hypothetical protein